MWPPDSPLSCMLVHSRVAQAPFGQVLTGKHAPVADGQSGQSAGEPATCLMWTWVKGILWGRRVLSSQYWVYSSIPVCAAALWRHSLRELHLGNQQEKIPPCLSLHVCFPQLLSPEMNVKWKGLCTSPVCSRFACTEKNSVFKLSKLLFDISSVWIKSWKNVKEDTLKLL